MRWLISVGLAGFVGGVAGCGDDVGTQGDSATSGATEGSATSSTTTTSTSTATQTGIGTESSSTGGSSSDTTGEPTTTIGSSGSVTGSSGSSGSSSSGAGSTETGAESSSSTGPAIDTCDPYPLEWAADPLAEAAAVAELAMVAPEAALSWDPERGTLSSLSDVNLPLAMCPDGVDAMSFAWDVVEAHPDIFDIDRTEWGPATSIPCNIIQGTDRTVTISRATLGGQPVLRDTFVFRLRRIDDVVTLRSVVGTYLPASTPELTELMGRCRDLDLESAEAELQSTALGYTRFFQCAPQGVGEYTPVASDTFDWDAEGFWGWEDAVGDDGVLLTKQWAGRVVVDEANYDDPLLMSDAVCPNEAGNDIVVGFRVTFDAVTNALLGSMPGIGCLVC